MTGSWSNRSFDIKNAHRTDDSDHSAQRAGRGVGGGVETGHSAFMLAARLQLRGAAPFETPGPPTQQRNR